MPRSPITTHVLDVSRGVAAVGVPVVLDIQDGNKWTRLASGVTDNDGRVSELLPPGPLTEGVYRLTFDTAAYQTATYSEGFYPRVPIIFKVWDGSQHYHVPLLLSPFGYSTYRGT